MPKSPTEFLQLSLLDPEPDASVRLASAAPPAAPSVAKPPTAPTVAPAAPLGLPGALWVHAQANRHAVLAGQQVGYLLKRGQRRTIGFSVSAQGLTVSAPRWTSLAAVDAALQTKADWVLRKLTLVAQQHHMLHSARRVWRDGVTFNWLGGQIMVRLADPLVGGGLATSPFRRSGLPHQPLVRLLPASPDAPLVQVLALGLPHAASPAQIQDTVQAWMMQAAQVHFEQRLNHFAPLLGVRWSSLRLSSAATRWGSAKADGSIRLHWRLMEFSPAVVDYVVAHELAHLRHMDHSPRFWHAVASVVPDYAALRAQLKGERLPPW